MRLQHIEQMILIRRLGSVSAAARELGMSQSTLSRSITRLESTLGLKLLDRTEAGARPTYFGEFLTTRGDDIVRSMMSLREELSRLARGQHGRLRVGVGPASRLKPLPQFIDCVSTAYPDLQLEVRQESGAAIVQGLHNARYDVVLTYAQNAARYGDLIRAKLFEDRIVAAVRPDHPLASREALTFLDLINYPLASFRVPATDTQLLDDEQKANLHAIVSDDPSLIIRKPLNSDYVAYVPRFVAADLLANGTLVEVKLAKPITFDCWMLSVGDGWNQPVISELAALTRQLLVAQSSSRSLGSSDPISCEQAQ